MIPVMKPNNIAVMAISVGLIASIGGFSAFELLGNDDVTSYTTSNGMLGHVTATTRDANGVITGYSQGDNLILDGGEECISKILFKGSGNTEGQGDAFCTGNVGKFNIIGLVNATACASNAAKTSQDPTDGCTIVSPNGLINSTTNGLQRTAPNSIVITSVTGGHTTTLTEVFTNTEGSNTIQRSVIMNTTAVGANQVILASQNFASAAVVSDGGTLTIVWEITTGGTTSISEEP